jgi:energy-coupling factor transport system ATP-binding protein
MIGIKGLTYTYPVTSTPALIDLNLEVPPGQFCAVVGANGAGKSTLCYAIAGFVPHFYNGVLTGSVQVAGFDVPSASLATLAGAVGLVVANPFNQITGARFTVREEIAFGLENLGVPRAEMAGRVDEVLSLAGLADISARSPYALSGGQQQRVAIASVIVMRPQVLVLDEPTSQLDPVGTREVFETLHRLAAADGITVVLAEHKLEWIAVYADRVIVLDQGRIVRDGSPSEVLADAGLAQFGLAATRYTQAARLAAGRGLFSPDRSLPVTLEQAVEFFRDTGDQQDRAGTRRDSRIIP